MADLPPQWFPDHAGGEITPFAQAVLYPYPCPEGDFVMDKGIPNLIPDGIGADLLRDRTPVLSVGSNRAPLQLRRKFGEESFLPVTTAVLCDVDVVFAALVSYYGAVPATGFPSPGARARLNIAWLDEGQLAHMHDTEARGIAYDFIRYHPGLVDHGPGRDRGDPAFDQPVFGYEARAGVLGFDGIPVAHAGVECGGRSFPAMGERDMLERISHFAGDRVADSDLEEWILSIRESRAARDDIMRAMEGMAIKPDGAPWDIVEGAAGDPEAYL